MTRLYLIRHAEVDSRYHRVFGGRLDIGLSDRGRSQAVALAEWLRRFQFDEIHSSPMERVQRTLDPLRPHLPSEPTIVPDLREVDFGDWTGLTWEEVHPRFGVTAYDWIRQLDREGFPNGESAVELRMRVGRALQQILEGKAGRTIGIFAHGGVIRMAISLLLGLPLTAMAGFDFDYGSVSWLTVGQRLGDFTRTEAQLLNFTPWRDL